MGKLLDFLESTSQKDYDGPLEFELDVLPAFCDALDIDQSHLYLEQSIDSHMPVDGIIGEGPGKKPWAILEAKSSNLQSTLQSGKRQTRSSREVSGAEFGVLIGKGYIWVIGPDTDISVDVDSATPSKIGEIEKVLTLPDSFPSESHVSEERFYNSQKPVSKPNYQINLGDLKDALNAVDEAKSNQEKGDTFEEFASLLFEAIPFLEVRDQNLVTNTGEVDLVVEYLGANNLTIFDDWSRFILVECKNWSTSVGVSQVRNFKGKMDKSQVDVGVIFARNGISGDQGADALRSIHEFFQREGRMIIVIDNNHIEQLLQGASFYDILDRSMYQRRFDFD